MNKITFDFSVIGSMEDFYILFADTFELPDYFEHNLDALWEVATCGDIPLPITIEFTHLPASDEYDDLINLFEQAEEELEGELVFVYPQPYGDDELVG